MIKLSIVITALIAISFICSILESVMLSATRGYIQLLIERGSRAGAILKEMKENIDEPISAILTLNTISHTAGAAVSGAMAMNIFGNQWMAVFSGILTLLILIFSEIIPKTIGARYWRRLTPPTAYILKFMVIILKPLLIPINFISSLFSGETEDLKLSRPEILNYIKLGYYEGTIKSEEFTIMENLFTLQQIKVKEIMTPRTVVFWLSPDTKIKELARKIDKIDFSRIPLYNAEENTITGIVLKNDIHEKINTGKATSTLQKISYTAEFIAESMNVYRLLNMFISEKIHIAVVINEYGDYTGIITLEDAIETLLGREIIDESDKIADMQELARKKNKSVL